MKWILIIFVFSFNIVGIEGALLQSLSHGFVSSALFLIIGVVYISSLRLALPIKKEDNFLSKMHYFS